MSQSTDTIPQLDRKGLREFGLVTGALVAVLFGLFLPWLLGKALPVWPWIIAGILAAWGLIAPDSLRPVHYGWMRLALLLNRITTPVILGLVFYLVILPMGVIARLFGYDPMARKLDETKTSYRVLSRKAPRQNMEKPF